MISSGFGIAGGYEPEEAMRQPLEDALTPASFEIVSKVLAEELAAEKRSEQAPHRSRKLELEVICKNGSTVWTEATMTFLRSPDGQPVEILGVTRDISERKQTEEALLQQTRFQRLLMDISLTYINLPWAEVSAAMNNSLAELGAFVGADRAYIFTYDFPAQVCTNTHEWCAEGIVPQINRLQAVPLETAPDWVAAHTRGLPFYIPDVSALPPGGVKDFLAAQEIQTLLTVPMMDGAACTGFIGFDSVHQPRHYSEDEQRLLRVFAELLVNVRRRQWAEDELQKAQLITENVPVGLHLYHLDDLADDRTLRMVYANPASKTLIGIEPEDVVGKTLDENFPGLREKGIPQKYAGVVRNQLPIAFEDFVYEDSRVMLAVFSVKAFPLPGDLVGVAFENVTARKQAEQSLEVALAKYKTLFETFPLGISVTDETGRILETNATAEKLLAVPQNEHTQRDIASPTWRLVREDGAPMPPDEFASVRALNEKRLVENVHMGILKPDETVTWLNVTAVPLPVPGYGVVITYDDITERKKIEDALRESETKLKAIFDYSQDAIALSHKGKHFWVNPAYISMFGFEEMVEILDRSVTDLIAPESRADVARYVEARAKGSIAPSAYETIGLRKDGSTFIMDVHVSMFNLKGERFTLATLRDITERKQMENKLRIKEWAISNSINAIALADLAGNLTFVNPAFLSLWGYPSDTDVLGKSSVDFWQSQNEASDVMAALKQQGHWRGELLGKRRDGSRFLVEVSASLVFDESGQPQSLLGVFNDITERKQAEVALQKSRELIDTALDTLPDTFFLFDPVSGKAISWNRAFCEITGYSDEEIAVLPAPASYYGTDDLERASGVLQRIIQGESSDITLDLICKDGHKVTTEYHAAPIKDEQGEYRFIIAIGRDITERKRAEDAKKLNEERLEALVALNNMTSANESELTHFAMETAVRLTGSTIGYIAFMNEDETLLTMYAWSTQAMRECAIIDKPIVYPVASTGLWGEAVRQRKAVITNDYAAPSPWKKGMPDDHVHVTRHMNAPTFDEGKIVIVAGVGNKLTDYNDDDVRQLSLLMSGLWSIIRRKWAEDALRKSEERYRSLFTRIPDGVYRSTHAGKFVDINPAMVQIFGYSSQEEMLGIDIQKELYFDPAERGSHILDTGGQGTETYRMLRKDGSEIWVEDHGFYAHDEQGNITFHEGILRDVTERRKAEIALEQASRDLLTAYNATLQGWSTALELREHETGGHSQRVVQLTSRMAQTMGALENQLIHIQRGALLHDIGKMGIPDSILLKPGPLTDEEWVIMRQHPSLAYRMLSAIHYLEPALDIPRYHHEKWDGTGYPYGLKGEEIPLPARIFSIIDTWDALSNDRPYRSRWSSEEVLTYIRDQAGKHFDPRLVEIFLLLQKSV